MTSLQPARERERERETSLIQPTFDIVKSDYVESFTRWKVFYNVKYGSN